MITSEMKNCQILLVDDEQSELDAYSLLLSTMGIRHVQVESDSRQVVARLETMQNPIVFLDLNMPHLTGQEVLRQLKRSHPQVPVIIITANSEIETAVECLKLGAHDYLVKPIDLKMFSSALRNALEISMLRAEVLSLKGISFTSGGARHPAFSGIVTGNPAMHLIFNYVESIAASGMPVLILGETGSGKELIAKAIHEISGLAGSYVAVDVSGLDDTLFSDTLFGHAKGAYTGADGVRAGLIEKAAGGTIFLDEIGDLSEVSQVKLLRLLQENVYYPLGSDRPKHCQARIVTAANKDLTMVAGREGEFRMDLYYRLSTHLIRLPPLRERQEDIPALAAYLAAEAAAAMRKATPSINEAAMRRLQQHPFWGNVRELKAYIVDAVARSDGDTIGEELLAARLGSSSAPHNRQSTPITAASTLSDLFGGFPTLDELTDRAVDEALVAAANNQAQASRLLGITRQALHKRLKKRGA